MSILRRFWTWLGRAKPIFEISIGFGWVIVYGVPILPLFDIRIRRIPRK